MGGIFAAACSCAWADLDPRELMATLRALRPTGLGRPVDVAEAYEALELEEGRIVALAPGTQRLYRSCIALFRRALAEEERSEHPDPRAAIARAMVTWPMSRRHVPAGMARRLGFNVPKVVQQRAAPRPLDTELWRRIVRTFVEDTPPAPGGKHAPSDRDAEIIWRDRAVVLLIAFTGLRPGDAASCTVAGWRRPRLSLTQKGRRPRLIVVPERAGQAIDDYLAVRSAPAPGVTALFLGLARDLATGSPLRPVSAQALSASIQRRARVRRLPHFELRQLRTTVATLLAEQGHGPYLVAAALGHQSLSTAQHYVDPTRGQAEAVAHVDHFLEQLLGPSPKVTDSS